MLSGNFADTKSVLSRINCNRLFFFVQVKDVFLRSVCQGVAIVAK